MLEAAALSHSLTGDDRHASKPCMALVSCPTDRHIYLVAVKVNDCRAKELSHLELACLKVER